ncbi:MAG TPA: metalloprotease [Natrialbaceae archaeon]|nr:metalloprotease [Natrialbaceae archaeon]
MKFSTKELLDFSIAWVVLGVAFGILLAGGPRALLAGGAVLLPFGIGFATAGVGFLLHELAHKVVAVRFGQVAEFRADYNMLVLTLLSAMAGFLVAAPGAVHHRGRVSLRERGLIALAGPVTNLALVVPFAALLLAPGELVRFVGRTGLLINALLAAFNMAPYGPLDGRTVVQWNKAVFVAVFVPSLALALFVFVGPLIG